MTLEQAVLQIENAQTNVITVGALQSGIKMQKELGRQMDINSVEDLIDEMEDLQQDQEELSRVWERATDNVAQDSDLMDELEKLETDIMDEKLLESAVPAASTSAYKPAAAATPAAAAPVADKKANQAADDEKALADLMAQLAS